MRYNYHKTFWITLFASFFLFTPKDPFHAFENIGNVNNEPVIIHNVRIFDGNEIIPENAIVIQNGIVKSMTVGKPDIPGADFIDGNGGTLLPGLIDSHVHTFGPALEQSLIFGVTTVLDMFAERTFAAQMRSEQMEKNVTQRADLFSAGTLVTAPGGHGTQFGLPIPTISSPDEADTFVKARIEEGSDYIKIVYDDGSAYGITFPTLDKETLAAVIRSANQNGKRAVVHIGRMVDARDAIELGADGLVHIFADRIPDEEFVSFTASKDLFIIPTLTVMEAFGGETYGFTFADDPYIKPFLTQSDFTNLQRRFPANPNTAAHISNAIEAVRKLNNAGVPILAGSDAPNPGTLHGASIHRELELLVEAGLSPVSALRSATSLPAKHFGLDDRGRIAPGIKADLVLVAGNPLDNIRETRNIVGVWKSGAHVNREAFRKTVEEERARAEDTRTMPPPAIPETGLIADFDGGNLSATFGAGWLESTDAIMGGKSTVKLEVVQNGANKSEYALAISGRIDGSLPFAWSGGMYSPGAQPMTPANLSAYNGIEFRANGDGRTYYVMIFSQARGPMPISLPFQPETGWKSFTFQFSDFDGIDGSDITAILFSAAPPEGEFELMIDDVSLIR